MSNLQGTGESDRCKSRSTNGLGAQWRAQPWLPPVNPVSWCRRGLLLTGKSTNWESQRGFIRLWSGLIYLQVKIIADDHQESPSRGSVPLSQRVTVRYSSCDFHTQRNSLMCWTVLFYQSTSVHVPWLWCHQVFSLVAACKAGMQMPKNCWNLNSNVHVNRHFISTSNVESWCSFALLYWRLIFSDDNVGSLTWMRIFWVIH